jgi:spore coat polysaccharide biosynthesis protein SpsF (cytidylyltransferase family)
MSVLAVVQARVGSTRLPGKVLADLGGAPLLQRVIERARRSRRLDQVVVATTALSADDPVAALAASLGAPCVRGSEDDVLSRYRDAAERWPAERIVRITADCPLLDAAVVDQVVAAADDPDCDYASNITPPTYPDGLDVEVVRRDALLRAAREATLRSEREHVTLHIRNHPGRYRIRNVIQSPDRSNLRWTVDEPADLDFARAVYAALGTGDWGQREVLELLAREPGLSARNDGIARDEGLARSLLSDGVY